MIIVWKFQKESFWVQVKKHGSVVEQCCKKSEKLESMVMVYFVG